MSGVLEILLTFVGVMFVLALVAQGVQEVVKAMFVFKGQAMRHAIESLVAEAVRMQGQFSIDARAIMDEVIRRVGALGQQGFRKKSVRLDDLPADRLRDLIETIHPSQVPGLPVGEAEGKDVLKAIAGQAERWYPLAVAPVDTRYRRRMRALALLIAVLVVIPLNAGADRVYRLARTDPEFRAGVATLVERLREIPDTAATADSAAAPPTADDTAAAPGSVGDSAEAEGQADTVTPPSPAGQGPLRPSPRAAAALDMVLNPPDSLAIFALPTWKEIRSLGWWVGILLSAFLVSVGAPFWHDLLETIFGLKNRMRTGQGAGDGDQA